MRSFILNACGFGVLLGYLCLAQAPTFAQKTPPPPPKPAAAAEVPPSDSEPKEAGDTEAAPPASSVDPALLKELLERLAKVETELRKLKGEKPQGNGKDEKPTVYALLETPYIGSTNYDPVNGMRFFAVKTVYINLGTDTVSIRREEIELDVDGTAFQLGNVPENINYHSYQVGNQQFQFQNLKTPERWTIPPGGTTAVWMFFADLPKGSTVPPMKLKTRFGEKMLELDVNQFALGALQMEVERIGPKQSLGLLTIGGSLDTINVGSFVDELDRLAANRVARIVVAFSEAAPSVDQQIFSWLQQAVLQAGRNNVNDDPRYPSFPATLREVHLCQLPTDTRGMVYQNPNETQVRIHDTIAQAVNAALQSAYEVLPRDQLLREIEGGHPLTRAAALANGGGRLSSEQLPLILQLADDNDVNMQSAALTALRHFGEPEAVAKLIHYVRKNAEPLSFVAIDSLADSRFLTAHEALLEVLRAEPPTSKKTIVQVLAQHPRPIWSDTIFEFAQGPPAEYTAVALQALSRNGYNR
ncbi:MAG: HEAT repeat domain-containing protein [Planctomycetaceae bacterium]